MWDGGAYAPTIPDDGSLGNSSGLYERVSKYGSVSDISLDFQAQAAILFGLSTTLKNVNQQLKTTCSSGNCTWPAYRTLGTCSKCNDVTDQISRSQKVDFPMKWYFPTVGNYAVSSGPTNLTTYSLPNGLALDNKNPNQERTVQSTPVLMTARSNVAPSQSVSFKDATTLIWSAATLYVPNSSYAIDGFGQWIDPTASNVRATECAIYLCIKEYTSQILNGQLIESYTDIASTRDAASWQVFFNNEGEAADTVGYIYSDGVSPAVDALYTNTTYLPRSDLSISAPRNASNLDGNNLTIVNATQEAIYALSAYIVNLFTSTTLTNASLPSPAENFSCTLNSTSIPCGRLNNVTGMVILSEPLSSSNMTLFDPPAITPLYDSKLGNQTFDSVFATLAESITNAMRGPTTNFSTISGQLGTSHTLLRVRWPWIALPLLCMIISASFLLFSIYEAHIDSTPLWKSGGLAYLAHGLDAQSRDKVKQAELSSEIDAVAEELKVRLARDEEGVLMLRYGGMEVAEKSKTDRKDGHDNMNGTGAPTVLSHSADAREQV